MTDEHRDLLQKCEGLLKEKLSLKNYWERFALLLACEEHQMSIDIRNFDMKVNKLLLNIFHFDIKEKGKKYFHFNTN